mgnify:CR=1 FL=1
MAHTFLALDMSLIPQTTKKNVPTFKGGVFSNDGEKGVDGEWLQDEDGNWIDFPTRMLIDGYNSKGELVHPQATLSAWLQWSDNATEIQEQLLSAAIEYTSEEFRAIKNDVSSIWYTEPEVLI